MKKLFLSAILILATVSINNIYSQCFSAQNFTTPGESTYTLPGSAADSYQIEIETKGADGGDFLWTGNPQTDGGEGATIKASFIIPGGSELLVIVGTSGLDAPGSPGGGGGGGGTAVILNNTNVLIAAGAGGGGGQGGSSEGQGGQANTNSVPAGGGGLGSSGGGGFNSPGGDGAAGSGGGAGTLNGQGIGGMGGVTAGSGGAGFGGGGGGSGTVGGGGGGYEGGDGDEGTMPLNGKGGDSYVNSLFSGTVIFNTPGIDGGGSNNNGSVTITCIPQNSVEINLVSQTDPTCSDSPDGSIEVSASGGIGPYQYSLNGSPYGDSPIFSNLSAGNYTISVQDGSGVTDMLVVTLTAPPAINGEIINIINNVCFGDVEGSIEVSATGGSSANGTYSYSLNGSSVQSSGTFINLPNGFYIVSIFDDNFCTTDLDFSITSPEELQLILISKTDITCFGMNNGSCIVDAIGGTEEYMYSLDNGPFETDPIFFDLSGGSHTITVQDQVGCTQELVVNIEEPDAISFDITVSDLSCINSSDGIIEIANLSGTAPYEFILDDEVTQSTPIFSGLDIGIYSITVIDANDCELVQSVELIAPDALILEVTALSNIECGEENTGSVQLELQNGEGEITYTLNMDSNTTGAFANLSAGSYSASAENASGCSSETEFTILESASFVLTIENIENPQCFGGSNGSFTIGVSGAIDPIQYSMDGGDFQSSPDFENLSEGIYTVQVTDASGCDNNINVTISEPSQLQMSPFDIQNVDCNGEATGSISFTPVGGTPPYTLNNNTNNIESGETITVLPLAAGDHILILSDSNGCEIQDTVTISQNDSLQLFVSEIISDSCGMDATGYLDLNATGGFAPLTYSLDGIESMDGKFDNLTTGTYTATVMDALGCSTDLSIMIPSFGGLVIDSLATDFIDCHGDADGSIELFINNAQGVISYYLNDTLSISNPLTGLSGGIYSITASDDQGCSVTIDIEISEPDPLTIDLLEENLDEGCLTVVANGGTQPYRYSIDNKVSFQDSAKFSGLEYGSYDIIVIDNNGCENTYSFVIDNLDELNFPGLKIFPNPAQNSVFITFEGLNNEVEIEIFDRNGKTIKHVSQVDINFGNSNIEIPVDNIASGSYFMKIQNRNNVTYRKIIILD